MTKEKLLLLCASLCLSLVSTSWVEATAASQTPQKEVRTTTQRTPSADLRLGNPLLADGIAVKKRLKIEKDARKQEIEQLKRAEDLQEPAVDLYGEDSWGEHVNPFTSVGRPAVPEHFDIDLNEFVMPIEKRRVTSNFGYRARFGRHHYGTDLQLSIGDTVRAAFSGKVRISSYEGRGYGRYVVIRHPNGLETVYGHLSRSFVSEGTIIKAGDPIALGGNTGRSTGPHLHFEARFMGIALNPASLFDFENGVPLMDKYTFFRGRDTYAPSGRYASSKAVPAKRSWTKKNEIYRIKSGDTLTSIASRHGVTVAQLSQLNRIGKSGKLKAGKTLQIPTT